MNDPVQDFITPFIRQRNFSPVAPLFGNGSMPMNAASRIMNGNGFARTMDDRSDLLANADASFYGGGNAPPTPTPTPTPAPRMLPQANVTQKDLETYGAGSQYGFTSPTPRPTLPDTSLNGSFLTQGY